MLDKLYLNGIIVTNIGKYPGSIGVKDGKIAVITQDASDLAAKEVIDCGGRFILPGFIDGHIHPCDPGTTHREDFELLTSAMAAGGITTGMMMPMNVPVIVDTKTFEYTKQVYEGRGYVDYTIHGAAISTNLNTVDSLWRETGATAIKMFMCFSTDDAPFVNDEEMYAHLEILAKNGGLALIHCENDGLIRKTERELKEQNLTDGMAYNASHPDYAEVEAIGRAILYLRKTGARAVIVHVSTAEGLRMIHKAQEEGVQVWAETCPHYLTFIDEDMKTLGARLKFSPPMRGKTNRQELWELLEKGCVQTVASDHCPFSAEEKLSSPDNIWNVPNGIPGVQTLAPVLLNAVSQGKISLEKVVELTSLNAARIYGLYPQKGALQVGSDADFVVVDMDLEKEYTEQDNLSKCPWSPYFGLVFKGWPVMTVCRGEVVYQNGKIVGKKGHGKYISRTL